MCASILGVEAAPSRRLAAGLPQERLRQLDVLRHADAAVHLDGFGEKLSRFVAIARTFAVEEHAGVEAADFRLLDDVGQLLGPAEGGAEVVLGLCPLAATSGRYARYRIQQAGI